MLKRKTGSVIMEISCKRVIWVLTKIIFILLLCIPLSPANIIKANNFYHTDSEVFFWRSMVGFGKFRNFLFFQIEGHRPRICQCRHWWRKIRIKALIYLFLAAYPPPTVTIVESPDIKSSLARRLLPLPSISSSSSESG